MAYLLLINTIVFGSLHVIWNKSDLLNFTIKIIFLVLLIVNGFQCAFAFGALRIEAAKVGSK
jgi:hypothetical protein